MDTSQQNRENIRTTFLLHELKESKSIYNYLKENHALFSETLFSEYLSQIVQDNHVHKSELIIQSGFSKSYVYAFLHGTRKPSTRNSVIILAISCRANLEQTQNLLMYADFKPLSPKVQRDCPIIFAIEQKLSVMQLTELLMDLEMEPLEKME